MTRAARPLAIAVALASPALALADDAAHAPAASTTAAPPSPPSAPSVSASASPEPRTSLWIDAPEGAAVAIDGEVVGTAPLKQDVGVPPGRRVVTASSNGHEEGRVEVDVALGEKRLVSVALDDTAQRKAAYGIIAGGLVGLSVAIAAGVAAIVKDREADSLEFGFGFEADYDAAIAARDAARIASGVAGGIGLGLVVTGGILFAFDAPKAAGKKAVAIAPLVAPGFVGVSVFGVMP